MMCNRVSIVVPYVKKDRRFEQTRRDLENQTHKNCEIIFCEDSLSKGPSWARNQGLAKATGDVILFADADDEIASDWVERMLAGLGDADAGWAGFTLDNGSSRVVCESLFSAQVLYGENIAPYFYARVFGYKLRDLPKMFLRGGLWKRCHREWAGVWRLALRREKFIDVRFDETLRLYEDAMFITEVMKKAQSVSLFSDAGYVWVVRPFGSMTKEDSTRKIENKFSLRDARKRIDSQMKYWRGSFILSFFEILLKSGISDALRYLTWKKK